MLPFEFTVPGPPLSHQTRHRDRLAGWRRTVLAAALNLWPENEAPVDVPIEITVVYYHDGQQVRIDDDNLLKPIQDAVNGHMYVDDGLITGAYVRKTPLDGSFRVRGMPRILADAFVEGVQFIYIRLDSAPNHRVLA